MNMLWFWIVSVMVAAYSVMDGFDLGAGALHLFVARTDRERRQVLAAIGPWWDGNEVWLLAGGGAMFLSFPKVLASGFQGFYMALFLVLWCLVLRGIGIEFRSHLGDGLWRAFWDAAFAVATSQSRVTTHQSGRAALSVRACTGPSVRQARKAAPWAMRVASTNTPMSTVYQSRMPTGLTGRKLVNSGMLK